MYTKETYKQVKVFFKGASKLGCLPVKYDEEAQEFQGITGKAVYWYYFMASVSLFRCGYSICIAIDSIMFETNSIADASVEVFYAMSITLSVFLNIGAYLTRDSLVNHLNQLMRINRKFHSEFLLDEAAQSGGRHPLTGARYRDGCSLFMQLLTPTGASTSLSFGLLFLLQSRKRIYFYKYIPGDKPVWLRLAYFLAESSYYLWNTPALYLFWYVLLLYGNSCGFWLQQIGASTASQAWTKEPLYNQRSALRIYKSLQILTIQLNNAGRDIVLPTATVFVILLQTVSLFVCVKFHTDLPIPLLLGFTSTVGICLVFEIITYPMLGKVYKRSVSFLRGYDGNVSREWRMMKRALPSLSVSVGRAYIIKTQTALTLISLAINVTSNLLAST